MHSLELVCRLDRPPALLERGAVVLLFFNGWGELLRTIVLALLAYIAVVVVLRVARKRTLAKMNVFDFVFIVALGSILATTILSSDVTLATGLVAFGTLVAAQWAVSWITTSSDRAERIINGEPVLLLHRGQCLRAVMRRERVTEEARLSAVCRSREPRAESRCPCPAPFSSSRSGAAPPAM